jgi:hypothetical protein
MVVINDNRYVLRCIPSTSSRFGEQPDGEPRRAATARLWGPPSRLFLFLQVQLQELLNQGQLLAQALLRAGPAAQALLRAGPAAQALLRAGPAAPEGPVPGVPGVQAQAVPVPGVPGVQAQARQ